MLNDRDTDGFLEQPLRNLHFMIQFQLHVVAGLTDGSPEAERAYVELRRMMVIEEDLQNRRDLGAHAIGERVAA